MSDYKYEAMWGALKDAVTEGCKEEGFNGTFSKAFLAIMEGYEETYESIVKEGTNE